MKISRYPIFISQLNYEMKMDQKITNVNIILMKIQVLMFLRQNNLNLFRSNYLLKLRHEITENKDK
jgi:hypothetical protein